MIISVINCDRCGRQIKHDDPNRKTLECGRESYHLCADCFGHLVFGFLTAYAASKGIKL